MRMIMPTKMVGYFESPLAHSLLGILPEMVLFFYNDFVWTENNEKGMTAKNVEALCSVGCSTKVGTVSIGKKGIGFKSVFKGISREFLDVFMFSHEYSPCIFRKVHVQVRSES